MPHYQYPLHLRFKMVALAPRIIVTDANDNEILFVHQKTWKLKEDVRVYTNQSKDVEAFRISADRIIDFSATYRFSNSLSGGAPLGSIKRKGMRSIWRSTYYIDSPNGQQTHHLKEDNPWTKMMDSVFVSIPVVSMFSGFVFNPSYTLYRGENREDENQPVMRVDKKPAFFEGLYDIELLNPQISAEEEFMSLLSLLMMIQLERRRG